MTHLFMLTIVFWTDEIFGFGEKLLNEATSLGHN